MSEISTAARVSAGVEQLADQRARTKMAASEFEGLLIAQMLRSSRSAASLTSLNGEDSGSSDAVMDFAEQQMSGALASAGGLGLATLVTDGLAAADLRG
jgi:Rod binding domain-containing protein